MVSNNRPSWCSDWYLAEARKYFESVNDRDLEMSLVGVNSILSNEPKPLPENVPGFEALRDVIVDVTNARKA